VWSSNKQPRASGLAGPRSVGRGPGWPMPSNDVRFPAPWPAGRLKGSWSGKERLEPARARCFALPIPGSLQLDRRRFVRFFEHCRQDRPASSSAPVLVFVEVIGFVRCGSLSASAPCSWRLPLSLLQPSALSAMATRAAMSRISAWRPLVDPTPRRGDCLMPSRRPGCRGLVRDRPIGWGRAQKPAGADIQTHIASRRAGPSRQF